jgi:hypothetical protein
MKNEFPFFSTFKGYNLPGTLPPQLVKLPYLKEMWELWTPNRISTDSLMLEFSFFNRIADWNEMCFCCSDFALNYLNGTIPKEWASIELTSM